MTDSNLDRLSIQEVSWAALLSHGLVLGAVGNAQSLFQGEFSREDQNYIGTIAVNVQLTTWSQDLVHLVQRCREGQVSTTLVSQTDFPWSKCLAFSGRVTRKLEVLLNFFGVASQTNKATKIVLNNVGPHAMQGHTAIDIRNYYDDVRMDGNGNFQVGNPENQFLSLSSVTVQNAGLTPVGVRNVKVTFLGPAGGSEAEYDYGMDPSPSWTLDPDNTNFNNLKEATLINECNTAGIDWCSFDFYTTTLDASQKQEWVERQTGQFLQDGSFRNSLSLELVGFKIMPPAMDEQTEVSIDGYIDIDNGKQQMAQGKGVSTVEYAVKGLAENNGDATALSLDYGASLDFYSLYIQDTLSSDSEDSF